MLNILESSCILKICEALADNPYIMEVGFLDKLKQLFANTAHTLNLVSQKLSDGQLLTNQDCLEVVRQINESSQEQMRLVKELEESGVVLTDCTSKTAIEEALADLRYQKDAQERLSQLHTVVRDFLSIRAMLDVHKDELARIQSDLAIFS